MAFDQKYREAGGRRQRVLCVSPTVGRLMILGLGCVARVRGSLIHRPKGHKGLRPKLDVGGLSLREERGRFSTRTALKRDGTADVMYLPSD